MLAQLRNNGAGIGKTGAQTATARVIDSQNGINTDAAMALIKEARRIIIASRGALF